jgi:hypothetical protein
MVIEEKESEAVSKSIPFCMLGEYAFCNRLKETRCRGVERERNEHALKAPWQKACKEACSSAVNITP